MYEAWINYRRYKRSSSATTAPSGKEKRIENIKIEPMEVDHQQMETADVEMKAEGLRRQEDEETHNCVMKVDVTANVSQR